MIGCFLDFLVAVGCQRGLLEEAKKVFTVENNAGAQLARLLRRETGIEVYGSILKYDGRPFSLDELKARVEEMV